MHQLVPAQSWPGRLETKWSISAWLEVTLECCLKPLKVLISSKGC